MEHKHQKNRSKKDPTHGTWGSQACGEANYG